MSARRICTATAAGDATARVRVALVVAGLPDADNPISNTFGLRTAQALARETDLSVIVLRAWRPRRRRRTTQTSHGLPVTTITVPQLPRGLVTNLLVYRHAGWPLVRSILREVDVVHSQDASSIGVIVGRWARRAGKAHVAQVTQPVNRRVVPHLWNRALDGWQAELDAAACNSEALAHEMAALWPGVPNVRTVYRGVDLREFHPDGPLMPYVPFEGATTRFLYAGGFPAYPRLPDGANTKGGFTLLQAWAAYEEPLRRAGATLVIAGPGCDRADVQAWHAQLGHRACVRILGAVPADVMPSLIRSSHAVVVPSLHEGLPNIALEASATARPVIGSDIPPLREVVLDGHTGLLLPRADHAALGDALVKAARDPHILERYGRSARVRMETNFDQRQYAGSMIELYRTAIALAAGRATR